jgi:drug/metabolite transporter (DMT)-like permease
MPSRPTITPQTGMLLVTLFWGGNFTAMKLAFGQIEPLAFTALRFALASVVLWMIVRHFEGPRRLPRPIVLRLIVLGLIGNTAYQLAFVEGLARTSVTKSALILAGMPALVTLAAWVLRVEPVTLRQRWAVLVATIGVVAVVVARGGTIEGGLGTGELLLFGGIGAWTVYTLLLRHWKLPISALRLTAWTMYTGAPGLILLAIPQLTRTNWAGVSWAGWGGVLYAALLSLVAAYILWNRGVAMLGASRASVYNCLVPLIATAVAMIGLGERPGIVHVAGGGLIIVGVLMTRRAPAPEG